MVLIDYTIDRTRDIQLCNVACIYISLVILVITCNNDKCTRYSVYRYY